MRILSMEAAGLLAAAFAGPAFAADPAETPMDSVFGWSGAYVGATIGYGWGNHTETENEDGVGPSGFVQDYDSDGVIGGIFAGYNMQSSMFVYGVEADVEYTGISGGFEAPGLFGTDVNVGFQGSLRARAGVALDRVLVYATAGAAFADIEFTQLNIFNGVAEPNSEIMIGWTVGAGAEVAVTDRVFVRGEYRYTDFGDLNQDSVTAFPTFNYDETASFHTARFGVGLRF